MTQQDWEEFSKLPEKEQQEYLDSWDADSTIEFDKANFGIEDNY